MTSYSIFFKVFIWQWTFDFFVVPVHILEVRVVEIDDLTFAIFPIQNIGINNEIVFMKAYAFSCLHSLFCPLFAGFLLCERSV